MGDLAVVGFPFLGFQFDEFVGDHAQRRPDHFVGAQSLTLIPDSGVADIFIPSVPTGITTIPIIGGSGIDTVNLHSLAAATPVTIFGNGGNDTINIAPGGSTQAIFSPVTVFGGFGDDTINLAPGAPFGLGLIDVPVTVNFATANGTASAGEDYTATSGTLTFAPGQTSKTISIVVHREIRSLRSR